MKKDANARLREAIMDVVAEAWGAYDNEGLPGQEQELGMYPSNFEHAHKEIFTQALEPVIEQYKMALLDIYDAGFAPEGRKHAAREIDRLAEQLRQALLDKIETYTEKGVDHIV